MSKRKLIILAALVIAVVFAVKFAYSKLEDYCPRCSNPNVSDNSSKINKDYANLEIVYSKNNGSLPPLYHREYIDTISTDEKGNIKGEYTVRDYNKTLEQKPLTISKEQLEKLIAASGKIEPTSSESANSGCTGGSNKSLKISQDDEILLAASAYNCAGKSTNESLEKFSLEIEEIMPAVKVE